MIFDLFLVTPRLYVGTDEGQRRGGALDDHALWEAYATACSEANRARRKVLDALRSIADEDLKNNNRPIVGPTRSNKAGQP